MAHENSSSIKGGIYGNFNGLVAAKGSELCEYIETTGALEMKPASNESEKYCYFCGGSIYVKMCLLRALCYHRLVAYSLIIQNNLISMQKQSMLSSTMAYQCKNSLANGGISYTKFSIIFCGSCIPILNISNAQRKRHSQNKNTAPYCHASPLHCSLLPPAG